MIIHYSFLRREIVNPILDKQVLIVNRYTRKFDPDSILSFANNPEKVRELNFRQDLDSIEVLNLEWCSLQKLPPAVYKMKNLKVLMIRSNPIDITNLNLCENLPHLEALDISNIQLKTLPLEIMELNRLKVLGCSNNELHQIPTSISLLRNLEMLDLSSNKLQHVPEEITRLKKLKILKLHHNFLESIPERIGMLNELERLVINNNQLRHLPESLIQLRKLVELDMAHNHINNAPWNLANLPSLKEIYWMRNPIEDFPEEMLSTNFVGSSRGLLLYQQKRKIYNENSLNRYDQEQVKQVIKGAQRLIYWGMLFLAFNDSIKAYEHFLAAQKLATSLEEDYTIIFSTLFLRYLFFMYGIGQEESDINELYRLHHVPMGYIEWCEQKVEGVVSLQKESDSIPEGYEDQAMFIANCCFDSFNDAMYLIKTFNINEHFVTVPHGIFSYKEAGAEYEYRNYFRGLVYSGKWKECLDLYALNHQSRIAPPNQRKIFVTAEPPTQQAYLQILQLSNNDPIGIMVHLPSNPPIFHLVDVPSNKLYELASRLYFREEFTSTLEALVGIDRSSLEYHRKYTTIDVYAQYTELQQLWLILFGAQIVLSYLEDGSITENYFCMTIHELLQENSIQNLEVIPSASLHGLPLQAAQNPVDGKYAIDYYRIAFLSMWELENVDSSLSDNSSNLNLCIVTDNNNHQEKLRFSQLEKAWIKTLFSPSRITDIELSSEEDSVNKVRLQEASQNASLIHFSTHSDFNQIHIKTHNQNFSLTADEILGYKLSPKTVVMLNCCHTSQADFSTNINENTLPLAFLYAGADIVIATVLPVQDSEAFRISCRVYELVAKGEIGFIDRYLHQACLEGKNGKLPFYVDEAVNLGYHKLAKELVYLKEYQQQSITSWQSYVVWKKEKTASDSCSSNELQKAQVTIFSNTFQPTELEDIFEKHSSCFEDDIHLLLRQDRDRSDISISESQLIFYTLFATTFPHFLLGIIKGIFRSFTKEEQLNMRVTIQEPNGKVLTIENSKGLSEEVITEIIKHFDNKEVSLIIDEPHRI